MTTPIKEGRNSPENEVRVSGKTNVFRAIERIEEALKKYDNITLSGINTGISKVLLITEISKIKFPDLHQYNLIETIIMEMKDDEKDEVDSQKFLTRFKVELYKNKPSNPPKGFYQAPYTEEELKKINSVKVNDEGDRERPRTGRGGFRGRGRFRGGRRGDRGRDDNRQRGGNFRGRGRDERDNRNRGRGGRGRGGRGRGRGDHFRRDDDRRREQSAPESGKRLIPGLGRGAKSGINY